MFVKAFEIFLQSLAYSFWPFIFTLSIIYLINKYFNHRYKHTIEKENKIIKKVKKEILCKFSSIL